jgi:uncharacterized Zn finger protein
MSQKLTTKGIASKYLQEGEVFVKMGAVRELEETNKGQFIAFVDDGAESYNVSISIDEKGILKNHTCDCSEAYAYCSHKTAVIHSIYQNETLESNVYRTKRCV